MESYGLLGGAPAGGNDAAQHDDRSRADDPRVGCSTGQGGRAVEDCPAIELDIGASGGDESREVLVEVWNGGFSFG